MMNNERVLDDVAVLIEFVALLCAAVSLVALLDWLGKRVTGRSLLDWLHKKLTK